MQNGPAPPSGFTPSPAHDAGAMPTYEYACKSEGCGHKADLVLSIKSDPKPIECPGCRRKTFERQISGGAGHIDRLRQSYPYYNWQLPVKPGQKPGEPNVMSAAHERDICAGAHDGERWERNAI